MNRIPGVVAVGDAVRIGTWDLGGELPPDLVELALEERLDVLAMQGVDLDGNGGCPARAALVANTPLGSVRTLPLDESARGPNRLTGVAVASRTPIGHAIACPLPNPGQGPDRGLLSCVTEVMGRRIVVVSIELYPFAELGRDAGEPAFAPVWAELGYHLAALNLLPMVVAGVLHTNRWDLAGEHRFTAALDGGEPQILCTAGLEPVSAIRVGDLHVAEVMVTGAPR